MGGEHRCPVCDATFTRPQHVARHMRSHTGDRPYRCQFCPDQFARSDLLSRHVNKCHEAEKPPPGPPGRKGSRTALRATSSKQTCDQCVKSSLSCDGAKPCARCTQRKLRCTFVEFNRQTAPAGPGHPDDATFLAKKPSTSSLKAPVSSPFTTTALSCVAPDTRPDYSKHDLHSWTAVYPDTSSAWNPGYFQNTSADHNLQQFVSSTSHRRGSLDYAASAGSGSIPSSASSSSSHLPIEAIPIHQSFPLNSSFDTFHNPSSEDSQAPFNSAFDVLSIHDPDAAPFFSQPEVQSQPILSNVVAMGMIADPNATPMARDDVNWSQLINTGTSTNLSHATLTPTAFHPRRRAASMFSVRTPTAVPEAFLQSHTHALQPGINPLQSQHDQRQPPQQTIYGVVQPIHAPVPVEDLSSWSAKVQSQRLPELKLTAAKVKARRQTLSGGEREREPSSHLLHPAPAPSVVFRPGTHLQVNGQAASFNSYRGSTSPVDSHTRSSSSSSWESTGVNAESAMRPSFKRLPSATPLEHDREHKRVLISHPYGPGPGSGEYIVSKIDDHATASFDHNSEYDQVLLYPDGSNVGSGTAERLFPAIEVENAQLGTAGPGITRVMNMADASVGGDLLFCLERGTL